MNIGIVGAGYICQSHIAALKLLPWLRIVAICDSIEDRALRLAKSAGVPKVYTSAAKMVRESGVDVAHVLTPPAFHVQAGTECLEGGSSVFLEKPAAVDSPGIEALRQHVSPAGCVIGVNHNAIYNPAFQQIVEAVQNWRLGQIHHVMAFVNVPLRQIEAGQHSHWMFQRFGNIILEQGPHPLSQVIFLLGEVRKASVLLSGPVTLNTGATFHTTWQIALQCDRGTAQMFLSFGREHFDNWIHVIGQDGSAFGDLRRGTAFATGKTRFLPAGDDWINSAQTAAALFRQGTKRLSAYALGFLKLRPEGDLFSESMRASIGSFYTALREKRPPPAGIEEGAAVIRACEMIIRAGADNE
jgi:predicted dehydrogenase